MTRPPWGTTVPGNRWDLADVRAEPGSHRSVSVVVPHFEQPAQLARTLAALDAQTVRPDEVLVADDGSAVPPVVPPGVRLLRQEDRGFRAAAARNLAAASASGDLLVFLDADTTPEPRYLEELTRLPARLPELVAVGRRRHATLEGLPVGAPLPPPAERHLPEPAWLADAHAGSRDLLDADATGFRFVISAVLACSRWWFEELGGFDATFVGYGGEDWELAHRSWLAGGLVAHVPTAVAWHDGPDAGAAPRTADAGTAEATGVADRVAVPGVAWRGLLRGPVDVVVDLPGALTPTDLLVTVDALLAALPRVRVVLDDEQRRVVGTDPRVHGCAEAADLFASARLHVRLRAGVVGGAAAYEELLGAVDGSCATWVVNDGAAEVRDLRLHRRAARWDRPDLVGVGHVEVAGLRRLPAGARLDAHLGQWL
ncbi:GT2 family glycosyltransferase [Nocardioides zeae]|uniref:GT2 family glycosyltransferase n=1 Tax=Nocardioides zeae TaxID=1457234 RepID=A0ACC6INP2_9ACTN|nr:glycosyltransferase [Nocardioides zeae]MDR6173737.1 GT2 family glycosyltransferase [Nocardioides zeae]MDR6212233.1 GT2 family glycosyltransferase [Nocardioides zeae]